MVTFWKNLDGGSKDKEARLSVLCFLPCSLLREGRDPLRCSIYITISPSERQNRMQAPLLQEALAAKPTRSNTTRVHRPALAPDTPVEIIKKQYHKVLSLVQTSTLVPTSKKMKISKKDPNSIYLRGKYGDICGHDLSEQSHSTKKNFLSSRSLGTKQRCSAWGLCLQSEEALEWGNTTGDSLGLQIIGSELEIKGHESLIMKSVRGCEDYTKCMCWFRSS